LIIPFLFFSFVEKWGFQGHQTINQKAIYLLPPEMFGFYKKHQQYLVEHSVDPDKRRYSDPDEAVRHYIDIDHYAKNGENPFEIVPRYWGAAVDSLSEDTLRAYGILPWNIGLVISRLSKAFEAKDTQKIVQLSAELGHYIADANVPLHTTENYDGQMTGQVGIHAFWESRLVELYLDSFDLLTPKAHYIENINKKTWSIIERSNANLPLVLAAEKEAKKIVPADQQFVYEARGGTEQKLQSPLFSRVYYHQLNGMVEQQMKYSIEDVASFWYTAWVNAGQPDLDF